MSAVVFLIVWTVGLAWAIHNGHLAKMWDALKEIIRVCCLKPKAIEKPKAEFGALHTYYGGHEITKAVEDIWSPIETVITAVEKQIENEVRISKSYREKPELIYAGHPWMKFVRSGDAAYLGWDKNHKPGPSPVEQRRMRPAYEARPNRIAVGPQPDPVDLEEYMRKGILSSDEMIPLITRLDADGRPIYAKAVPASAPKPTFQIGLRNANGIEVRRVVQSHTPEEVRVTDPDSGEYLGSVGVCPCGDCESEPWDDRLRNGS